jgi:cyanophycinase
MAIVSRSFLYISLFATFPLCSHSAPLPTRPALPPGLVSYLSGTPQDTLLTIPEGPGIILMGGGTEVDAVFRDKAFPLMPAGNIVVLRTNNSDGYNSYLFDEITTGPNKPSSVETLVVDTRAKADTEYVAWALSAAEMIWFAGGDQSTYTSNWRNTRVQSELQAAYDRGAIIGGTSAGMAIMGELIYDPGTQSSLTTANIATDAYHPRLILSQRLLQSPWMNGVITDTHFRNRDRLGRLLGMMAYAREEARLGENILGVAASEASCIYVDANGLGTTFLGPTGDAVYIFEEQQTTTRDQVNSGAPLVYSNILRYRLLNGDTYNFANRSTSVPPLELSFDGRIAPAYYAPPNPYAPPDEIQEPPTGDFIYAEFFTNTTATLAQLGFTTQDLSGGNAWSASTRDNRRVARINFNSDLPKNDWLLTPSFALEAGRQYQIEFWVQGGGSRTLDDLDLWIGPGNTNTDLTTSGTLLLQLRGMGTANNPPTLTPTTPSLVHTATLSGLHRLAFHARSAADQNDIRLDEITVKLLPEPPQVEDQWLLLGEPGFGDGF